MVHSKILTQFDLLVAFRIYTFYFLDFIFFSPLLISQRGSWLSKDDNHVGLFSSERRDIISEVLALPWPLCILLLSDSIHWQENPITRAQIRQPGGCNRKLWSSIKNIFGGSGKLENYSRVALVVLLVINQSRKIQLVPASHIHNFHGEYLHTSP